MRYRPAGQARHTFASQLLTAGINERWIATQMGHTSLKMIEKHYGRWMEQEAPDMSQRVEKALGLEQQQEDETLQTTDEEKPEHHKHKK